MSLSSRATATPLTPSRRPHAFTLVEIMVSLAVLSILLLVSAQVIGQVQRTWSSTNARTTQFKEARTAFDVITRNLSQATLDSYWDYDANYLSVFGSSGNSRSITTSGYLRRSYLHFVCGPASSLLSPQAGNSQSLPGHGVFFQAPLGITNDPKLAGLDRLLCARGYFVQYASDEGWVPAFVRKTGYQSRYRYRLMEYCPPAEFNAVYNETAAVDQNATTYKWFNKAGISTAASSPSSSATLDPQGLTRPVADNVVALIISPRREVRTGETEANAVNDSVIAPSYAFDSRSNIKYQHLLPPTVRVALIAIDERSAVQMETGGGGNTSPPLPAPTLTTAQRMNQDIELTTNELLKRKLNYRVFSATVTLRSSKFSELLSSSSQ